MIINSYLLSKGCILSWMVRSIIEDQLGTLENIRGHDLVCYVCQHIENSNFLKTRCECSVLYIVPTMIGW